MSTVIAIANFFTALLAKVPGEAWGALIAIGGVLLASRAARKESAKQRLFEMRRTVYLEAAEAIARAQNVIGSMGDLEIPNRDIARDVNAAVATLAKIQVVGHPDTVRAVTNYQAVLTEALTALWPKRWELLNRRKIIEVQEKAVAGQLADKDRWLEEMKQQNVQGLPDPQHFKRIQQQFDTAEKLRLGFTERLAALNAEQLRDALVHFEHGLQELDRLMQAIPPALARSRAELELPGDESEFVAILTQLKDRQQSAVRGLSERILQTLTPPQRKPPPPPTPPAPPPAAT
jgi:hypothetical protein